MLIAPLFWGGARSVDNTRAALRLVVYNANHANTNYKNIGSYLAKADVDVVILIEATAMMRRRMEEALPDYRSVGQTRTDAFGLVAFSRLPILKSETLTLADHALPSQSLIVETLGERFAVLGLHTMPPVGATAAGLRDAMLSEAAAWAMRHDNAIIAGDFNATPWSHAFKRLLSKGDLRDSERGFGLQTSWPAQLWPLSIAIDHCVHSSTLRTHDRSVGPFLGSDHRPLHLTLGFAPSAQ